MGKTLLKCRISRNVYKIFGKDTDTNLKNGDKLIKLFNSQINNDPPLDEIKPFKGTNLLSVSLLRLTNEAKLLKKGKEIAKKRSKNRTKNFNHLGQIIFEYDYLKNNPHVLKVEHCDEMGDCSHCHIIYNFNPIIHKKLTNEQRQALTEIFQHSKYIKI